MVAASETLVPNSNQLVPGHLHFQVPLAVDNCTILSCMSDSCFLPKASPCTTRQVRSVVPGMEHLTAAVDMALHAYACQLTATSITIEALSHIAYFAQTSNA